MFFSLQSSLRTSRVWSPASSQKQRRTFAYVKRHTMLSSSSLRREKPRLMCAWFHSTNLQIGITCLPVLLSLFLVSKTTPCPALAPPSPHQTSSNQKKELAASMFWEL